MISAAKSSRWKEILTKNYQKSDFLKSKAHKDLLRDQILTGRIFKKKKKTYWPAERWQTMQPDKLKARRREFPQFWMDLKVLGCKMQGLF